MLDISDKQSLLGKNSLGVPALCDAYMKVSSEQQLVEAVDYVKHQNLDLSILAGGTNLVLGKHIPGMVLHIQIFGREVLRQTDESVYLRIGAGENWHDFVTWSLSCNYFGLENLALIPGSCGAAPVQNIGAYGIEVSQFVEAIEYYDIPAGEVKRLSAEDCRFGYRDSIFKQSLSGKAVITYVEFRLSKKETSELGYPALADYMDEKKLERTPYNIYKAVCALRESKLPSPDDIPNVGSFFKNPVIPESVFTTLKDKYPSIPGYPAPMMPDEVNRVKIPAAWLIDMLGYKGKLSNGIGVHAKQALVIINPGHRTGDHILEFASEISSSIKTEFNIDLEIEPQIWGCG